MALNHGMQREMLLNVVARLLRVCARSHPAVCGSGWCSCRVGPAMWVVSTRRITWPQASGVHDPMR